MKTYTPSQKGLEKVSPHFAMHEVWCRHCHQLQLDQRLIPALEDLRTLILAPIVVNSCYRCRAHNASLPNSASSSKHILGMAADIWSPKVPLRELYEAALRVPAFRNGGVGVYPEENFIHVDVHSRRRWGWLGRMVSIDDALRQLG